MKVLIIEDERLAAEKLHLQLRRLEPGIEVLAVTESVVEAVNWFLANPAPDLVFADIQLEDGISFEIFECVKTDAPVIFTTAFDEYAIRAFKLNSVDYLLKPIDENELEAALAKFRKTPAGNTDFEQRVAQVVTGLSQKYKARFLIKTGQRFLSVPVNQVCCFFVEERSTFLRTIAGKTYDLDHSLDQLQNLVDPQQFFRVSRNFLININCIAEISSFSSTRLNVKLNSGFPEGVIVSRDKVSEFKRWMDQ